MIVFTHIPKTAGTSLKDVLRRNFGIHHVDTLKTKRAIYKSEDLSFAKRVFPGVKAITGHNLVDPPQYIKEPGMQMITMLRKPLTRCASHYQDRVLRGNLDATFESWITDPQNQNHMCKTLTGSDDLDKAKKLLKDSYCVVGITEHFQDSLRLLQIQLDKSLDLFNKRRITASSNEIKERLLGDESLLKLLEKYNQLDQQLYDYALEEVFLPAVEKYRDQMESIVIPDSPEVWRNEIRRNNSVRYNKFVYRPLIKALNK